jgi:hypothetical protein
MKDVISASTALGKRPLAVVLVLVVLVWALLTLTPFFVPQAGAASGKEASSYSEQAVVRAFKSKGLGLYDTGYNTFSVKNLLSVKAHDGWRLGIYIYKTEKLAKTSFNANVKAWVGSGMAATTVKNVVVTVVPNGSALAKKAKRWPMPKLVLSAIAQLAKK